MVNKNKFKYYSLKECCPDLSIDCVKTEPKLSYIIIPPTSSENNNGTIILNLEGILKNYYLSWSDGVEGSFANVGTRTDLSPGQYTLSVTDGISGNCIWTYIFDIPEYNEFFVELYYRDAPTVPVPGYPVPPVIPFTDPENTIIKWNVDRKLKRGTNGNTQCYELRIRGGTGPYRIKWEDFRDYGSVPINLVPPSISIPPQTTLNNTTERPPIVIDKIETNRNNGSLEACVNVIVGNGNGWIRIVVNDSGLPAKVKTIWLYVMQSPVV